MAKKTTNKSVSTSVKNNETKVMCPVCGSEFAIGEHEHTVKNATVIGTDSGLGTVYLPLSKRGEALKAAGIDTSKYFSIQLPTGGEQMMKMDADGKAVPVSADDPIIKQILGGGTVPNRNLFRRWIMSQVFHWLVDDEKHGNGQWLKWHGYVYQWDMLIEELRVQSKLDGKDMENFRARNRWFNKVLAIEMANDYIVQLRNDAKSRKQHKCKGVPYVTVEHKYYFLTDIEKKLIYPMYKPFNNIRAAKTPMELYYAVRQFWREAPVKTWEYKQCAKWKDAYKGMGAYATMQNLLRFHGCTFPRDNEFYQRGLSGLVLLERAAKAYEDGEGWRLFGLMKQMIEENGIDIKGKMAEWKKAKKNKR